MQNFVKSWNIQIVGVTLLLVVAMACGSGCGKGNKNAPKTGSAEGAKSLHDKLLGSWSLDIEATSKSDPAMKDLSPKALAELKKLGAQTAFVFTKDKVIKRLLNGSANSKAVEIDSYSVASESGKKLVLSTKSAKGVKIRISIDFSTDNAVTLYATDLPKGNNGLLFLKRVK